MTQEDAPAPRLRRGGKRQPLSCLACRQHKLRCDRRIPCSTCVRYRRETQCRQNPAPPSRKKKGRSVTEQAALDDEHDSSVQDDLASAPLTRIGSENVQTVGSVSNSQRPQPPRERIQSCSAPATEGFAALARLLGMNSSMDGTSTSTPTSLPQILAEANRVEQISSWWAFLDPQNRRRLWQKQLSAVLPSRSQCDLLINYYLDHINWIFQTVHVPSFRREHAQFWDSDVHEVDLIWLSLLLTMISVSALYVPLESIEVVGCPRDSIRHLAHVWHLASQHALRAGEYDAKPCLTQLQAFSVTQLYWYATNNIETMNSYVLRT